MTGRPSKIQTKVKVKDPETDEEREVSITDAFVEMLEAGCYIGHICQAVGISEQTLSNWRARGREWLDSEGQRKDGVVIEDKELPFVEFVERAVVAEGVGITWHERNIHRGAKSDPRLSLYFLERRRPAEYGRRLKVSSDEERTPAPLDAPTAKEARESFLATHVPKGVEVDSVLPEIE